MSSEDDSTGARGEAAEGYDEGEGQWGEIRDRDNVMNFLSFIMFEDNFCRVWSIFGI